MRDLGATAVFRAPRGRAPQFSPDGRFVVYRISAPVADVKAAEKAAKPPDQRPKDGLGITDLADVANARTDDGRARAVVRARARRHDARVSARTVTVTVAIGVARRVPCTGASTSPVAAPRPVAGGRPPSPHRPAAPTASARARRKGRARTRRPRSRSAGSATPTRRSVANVSAYAVSADGSHVAYVVQTKTDESIHVRDVASGKDQIVAHGVAHLASPALSPDGASLAYLSDPDAYDEAVKKEAGARSAFRLMVADTHGGAPVEALGAATPGLAPRTFASDARTPEFSADGSAARAVDGERSAAAPVVRARARRSGFLVLAQRRAADAAAPLGGEPAARHVPRAVRRRRAPR